MNEENIKDKKALSGSPLYQSPRPSPALSLPRSAAHGEATVQAVGANTVNQAVEALIIAGSSFPSLSRC